VDSLATPTHAAPPGRDVAILAAPCHPALLRRSLRRLAVGSAEDVREATERPARTVIPDADLRLRVLVAEDNLVNQKIVGRLLARWRCRAIHAETGRLAVARFGDESPDLILMDCQMPDIDGFEATRKIRELERLAGPTARRIPIVAMTAHAMSGDRQRCLDAGMDDYIAKPLKPHDLLAALSRWCGRALDGVGPAPPPEEDGEAPFRSGPLSEIAGTDDAFRKQILSEFLESAERTVQDTQEAVAIPDLPRLHRGAHRLKGAAATIGADRLAAACAELERVADGTGGEEVEPLVARLREELDTLRRFLEDRPRREAA
ncbi:MAG: response regulator, partial [Candidatus Eisenbacteria bacterium]|nr:response regulator [Candidatus Latescibacterota bacterium]MBD3302357.1 response regulator [Candidatus Eisenbacteria bacterium]